MKALADPNIQIIGLHFSNQYLMNNVSALFDIITNRAQRDQMFDVFLKATVTNKPDIKKIQDEIAGGLKLKLDEKSIAKRATILLNNIKEKQKILKILVMFGGLYKGIDMGKVGIPYEADHNNYKILLASTSEDVLSNQMRAQRNFPV